MPEHDSGIMSCGCKTVSDCLELHLLGYVKRYYLSFSPHHGQKINFNNGGVVTRIVCTLRAARKKTYYDQELLYCEPID